VLVHSHCLLLRCSSARSPGGVTPPTRCPRGLLTEGEGATSEAQCLAPPGWFLPDNAGSNMQECPSGTYKEVSNGAAASPLLYVLLVHCCCCCCCCCKRTLDVCTFGSSTNILQTLLLLLLLCRVGTAQAAAHLAVQAPGCQSKQKTWTSWTLTLA
jgi:hypothetical protein